MYEKITNHQRISSLLGWSGCFIQIVGKEPGKAGQVLFESSNGDDSQLICSTAIRILQRRIDAPLKLARAVAEYAGV